MVLFCGKNLRGIWKASTDKTKIDKFDNFFECELDDEGVHNDKVYMIITYHGYDYDYSDLGGVVDVRTHSTLYNSMASAKKSTKWRAAEKRVEENPKDYHVTLYSIASDHYGSPFTYGDVAEDKFNMKIIGVKIV